MFVGVSILQLKQPIVPDRSGLILLTRIVVG